MNKSFLIIAAIIILFGGAILIKNQSSSQKKTTSNLKQVEEKITKDLKLKEGKANVPSYPKSKS